jgi:hypothetical protein
MARNFHARGGAWSLTGSMTDISIPITAPACKLADKRSNCAHEKIEHGRLLVCRASIEIVREAEEETTVNSGISERGYGGVLKSAAGRDERR